MAGINTLFFKNCPQHYSSIIVAYATNECSSRAHASTCNRLVQPLATGMFGITICNQRFARLRQTFKRRNKIKIGAADHHYIEVGSV